jgi:outer membrane protein assembly factor BamB
MKQHSKQFSRDLRYAALAAVALLAAIESVSSADDWPLVRGDIRGSGVAAKPVPDKLDVVWTYHAGKDAGFDATAVVSNGVIYVGDNAGTFHAVRLADGKGLWIKSFEDSAFDAGAAVGKDRIYVGDLNGTVRCLSTADGTELWKKDLDTEIHAGPTLIDDNVLVTTEAGGLHCFNAADGAERWPPFTIEAPLRCAPTVSAGRVMLAGCDAKLHFIDIATGKETATVDIDGPTGSTAAMSGDRIYFGTEGGTMFAIDAPAGDKEPAVAWEYRDARRGQPIRSAAAVTDKLIVYGSQGKAIYALDPASGKLKWNQPLATRTRVESSPVIAGDQVIAATAGGVLYVLDAATSKTKWQYEAGGNFTASPAVVDGQIILGNGDGTLYCFGSKSQSKNNSTTETTETTEKK